MGQSTVLYIMTVSESSNCVLTINNTIDIVLCTYSSFISKFRMICAVLYNKLQHYSAYRGPIQGGTSL